MMDPLAQIISNLWNGKLPLWLVFWGYGQGVYAVILAAYIAMYKLSYDALAGVRQRLTETGAWETPLGKLVATLATVINVTDALGLLVITAFLGIAIWRAAPNTDWVVWTYLARAFVIAFWILIVAALLLVWQTNRSH